MMKFTSKAAMISIQTLLTLLMFLTHTRAKKLCDVRIWYLNIVTADVFNADLTDIQMSLKESIEALVMNSADNRDTRMVDCNVLYMYNDMLNEQFNYAGTGSGMAMKEIDSDTRQTSDDDSMNTMNEYSIKDKTDSDNEDDEEASSSDTDGNMKLEVSEHVNKEEVNMNKINELEDEMQMIDNEIDNQSQEIESDDLSTAQKDTDLKSDDEPSSIENNKVDDILKEVYQSIDDQTVDDMDGDNDNVETDVLHQFIDLSNEYIDGSDDTEIDDTETNNEHIFIATSEQNEETSDNVNDNISGVSETNNKSSVRRGTIPFGVCWSLGCSVYDILIFNTKYNENTLGTLTQKEQNTVRNSRLRLQTKKLPIHNSCTLIYFYELLFLNTVCVSNYSLGEPSQIRVILESVINNKPLHDSDKLQEEATDTDNPNMDISIDMMEQPEAIDNNPFQGENNDEVEVTLPSDVVATNMEEKTQSTDHIPEINSINERETSNKEQNDVVMNDHETAENNVINKKDDGSELDGDNTSAEQAPNLTIDIEISHSDESKSSNDKETDKQRMESFKEFEKIIEQKTSTYYTQIQAIEVMIMKLENKLLSEALHKQNHSSTITKLENHILKLENELLKMNRNYQNLREEADNMSTRQNKYLELAYKQQANKKYPELPDHTSKSHELISQHQSKLSELAFVLKNQSNIIMLLQEKYESLEEQNRQLHQMVMNQTIFMTSIIKTVQDLSEQNIQNQKEIIALRQKIDEKSDSQTQIEESRGTENSNTNVIDELDSLLFHNRNEKINSVPIQYSQEEQIGKLQHSDTLLQKYMMKDKSAKELISGWCPKSTKACPLCQNHPIMKTNCIPFQFIIWFNEEQDTRQTDLKAENRANSIKSNTYEPHLSAEHFANTDESSNSIDLKDITLHTERTLQDDTLSSEDAKPYSSENKEAEEAPMDNNINYGNELEHYQLVGYGKDGKPVWKMRESEVDKINNEKEKLKTEEEDTIRNLKNEKDSDSFNDRSATEESSIIDIEKSINNANGILEEKDKETNSEQTSNREQKTNEAAHKELTNISKKSNEESLNEELPLDENKTIQELNTDGKQINADPDTKDSQNAAEEELNIKDTKPTDVSNKGAKELIKESDVKEHTSNDTPGTIATMSNTNVKQTTIEQNMAQDSDDGKTGKTQDTMSDITQDTSIPKLKKVESNPESAAGKVENSKDKTTSKQNEENSQQQNRDENIKDEGVKDSNKNVNATKHVPSKQKETENKPKERKIPINLQEHGQKQYEPKDCYDYYARGDKRDGIYKVKPVGSDGTIEVFCDMRRGGWTVIQRRQDGSTNFFQEWNNYKKGFGGLYGEHWLGNDNIHLLTNQDYYKLYVDLMDWDKTKKHAEFEYFLLESEAEGYRIHIDGYHGDAGDGLTKHDGHKFSTKDVDNDKVVKEFGGSCAKRFNGAGWYYKCYSSNLNGKYYKGGKIPEKKYDGVTWKPWTGPNYSLKKVEMKIRPASVKK